MADLERSSSFLPTIKCSMCARDIEISMMGEHVCGGSGEPTPPPDSYGNFDKMLYKQNPTNSPTLLKLGRVMPPKVDTSAANRPFLRQDQLTPVSASPSRSASPMTPNDGRRSSFGRPTRSATAPILRVPPSPELLSSNLDCAFPPFPPAKTATKPSGPQQGRGYGSIGSPQYTEPDPMYAPVSPRSATTGGILQRMNTIAPGPFDVNGRRKAGGPAAEKVHQRNVTMGKLEDFTMSTGAGEGIQHVPRPSTASSGHSRTSTNSSNGGRMMTGRPIVPRKNGYGGFGLSPSEDDNQQEPLRPENRSQTFPLRSESQASIRRPSESAIGERMRRPSNDFNKRGPMDNGRSVSGSPPKQRKPSISGPDLSRPLPPRGASLIRPRIDVRMADAPPIPANVNLAAEFGIGNPYHTPTESQSSNASGYSEDSKTSSRSSPPLSTSPSRSRRKQSNTSNIDVLMSEIQSSMIDLQPKELPSTIALMKAQAPIQNQYARFLPPQNLDPSLEPPESPMDPAIQGGRLSPLPPPRSRPRPTPSSNPKSKPVRRPTTAKGNCKGCGEPIKGKSVSSADGRLTGRYHKQCFVCATCSEPFSTSTFYVINDAPYCERHYHKLNGSVCSTCDKGIEGQYLESERKQKFHPRCLTCADCKRSLKNEYFEMNGRVYCERDAFRRTQQARFFGPGTGGSNRMERRTTRLMMM